MLNVVWHLGSSLTRLLSNHPPRSFSMAFSSMSESPLEKIDQMLRDMHPTWWRAFGQEQNFDNAGVGADKPWWERWEGDETAEKPTADAAVDEEGVWGEATQEAAGMSSDPIPPPPATFVKKSRRADGRTRTHKKPVYPSDHALTRARKSAAMQKNVWKSN